MRAGPSCVLGRVAGRSAALERDDGLDVLGVGEHVDGGDAGQAVAALAKDLEVARRRARWEQVKREQDKKREDDKEAERGELLPFVDYARRRMRPF